MIYINSISLQKVISKFPNGEQKVLIDKLIGAMLVKDIVHILWKPCAEYTPTILEDLMLISWIKADLQERKAFKDSRFILEAPYLPYSRMDRETGGQMFTLKHMANTINAMNFNEVIVNEVHSDVSLSLIHNITNVSTSVRILKAAIEANIPSGAKQSVNVLLPDKGAYARYKDQIKAVMADIPVVKQFDIYIGSKVRDPETGNISGYTVSDEQGNTAEKLKGSETPLYIIDDLCCGGRTFYEAAGFIRGTLKATCPIYLCVTHLEEAIVDGIKRNETEENRINGIYATMSMNQGCLTAPDSVKISFPLKDNWTNWTSAQAFAAYNDSIVGKKINVTVGNTLDDSITISGTIEHSWGQWLYAQDGDKCSGHVVISTDDSKRYEISFFHNFDSPHSIYEVSVGELAEKIDVWKTNTQYLLGKINVE